MTSVALDLTQARDTTKKRRKVAVLLVVMVLVAGALFMEWRYLRRSAAPGDRPADTMCVAARIGLPCRP